MVKKETSIYKNLIDNTSTCLKEVAFTYEFKKFSYKYLIKMIQTFSFNLLKHGIKKNDVVTLCLINMPSTVFLLFSLNQIGAKINLLHPLSTKEEIISSMDVLNSKYLFTFESRFLDLELIKNENIDITYLSPVKELNIFKKSIYYLKNKCFSNEKYLYQKGKYVGFDSEFKNDSFFLHSGGTSGKSKVIALSSYSINSLISNVPLIIDFYNCKKIKMASILPIFHGFGLALGLIAPLFYKGSCCLLTKFKTNKVVNNIKKRNINCLIGVPTVYEALLNNKRFNGKLLRNLYVAFVGGDYPSTSLFTRFNELMEKNNSKCRLFEGYGLTETVTVCSVNTYFNNKVGSVGKLFPNVKVLIKKFDNEDILPLVNELGEIYIGGETLMNGYINSFSSFTIINNERYINTGDIGYIDNDNYLFFKSRSKRIIKIKGINVFPSEIEKLTNEEKEVNCSVAIEIKDNNECYIKLFIQRNNEYKNVIIDERIKEKIKKRLGVYSVPKVIEYVDKFEKTLIGKIDYKKLK